MNVKYPLFISLLILTHHFWGQKPEVVVSTGHTDQVNTISISDDAQYIVTGSIDKTVKIIETASGKELRTLSGNNQRVSRVKFDHSGKYIGAHLEGESLKIYDFETGATLSEIPSSVEDFGFCLDQKAVVYMNEDNFLSVADFKTSEVKKVTEISGVTNMIVPIKDDKTVVLYDYQSYLTEVDLTTGSIVQKVQVFPKYRYATCRMAMDPAGRFVIIAVDGKENGKDGELHVFDRRSFKEVGVLKGHDSRIFDIICNKRLPHLISTSHDGTTKVWDLERMKMIDSYRIGVFGSVAIETHPNENYFLQADMAQVNYINEADGKVVKTFKPLGNRILNLAYDQKGNYLVSSGINVSLKIWDLEQNKIARSIQGFWPIDFSPNGKELVSMYSGIALAVWDPSTGEQKHTLDTEYELIQNVSFNRDGSLLAGAGFQGVIKLWDMKTYKLIKKFTGHVNGVYATSFSPDGNYLASAGMDETVRIWDLKTGKEIKKLEGHTISVSDVKFSPDGTFLVSSGWDKTIRVWNTSDWSLRTILEGHTNMITSIDISPDSKYIASAAGNNVVAKADNSVIIWDVATGTQRCKYTGHRGMVHKVIFDVLSDQVYSTGDDGTIRVWSYKDCQEIATMASVGENEYVVATPDNYYMSSKDALDAVSFRIGSKLYPFEQFDLKLNRPDIICARLGKTPQGLINAYKYVYKKRLRKMGFSEDDLGDDFHLPTARIVTKINAFTTSEKHFKFDVAASDDKYLLNRLNVYVNDVPIYGLTGLDLTGLKVKSVSKQVDLELAQGVNKVQVSVHNDKGVESLRETFRIVYNGEVQKGDLYLITIGVSNYQNKAFNLKYAAKDAKDVYTKMMESATLYQSVKHRVLTDEEVTRENILGLQEFLSTAKEDDAVIIFVAGHGLLDAQLDYYYATYDIDFDNPSEKGVSYDVLETLLSLTKAYQKLLIMDTCHSGELDKEEVEENKGEDVRLGDVEFRAVGVGVRQKEGFGMENAGELMESLFTDVRKGTGATVISSAGGAEYAMESAAWKNGLFTYCLLNGIASKAADINKDGEIHVSELREYVYDEVTKLSGGKQKPTARSQNLSIDYRVW